MKRFIALILLMTLVGVQVLLPAGASAAGPASSRARTVATSVTNDNALTAIPITGTVRSHGKVGAFTGMFNIRRFVNQNGHLYAQGTLTGFFRGAGGAAPRAAGLAAGALPSALPSTSISIPVAVAAGQTCQVLHLDLGPLSLNLLGLQINLSRVVLDITAVPGAGNLLGNLLCAVANLLNGGGGLQGFLANLLNGLLNLLRPVSLAGPLATLPLSGTVGGTNNAFAGIMNVAKFVQQNGQMVAMGTVTGATSAGRSVSSTTPVTLPITFGSGGAAAPAAASLNVPASGSSMTTLPRIAAATCSILHLDLGPTSLNLLGLQINLSRVVLDITAVPGAGNLLGNLLCSIANLLNPTGLLTQAAVRPATVASAHVLSTLATGTPDLTKPLAQLNDLLAAKLSTPLTAIPVKSNARMGQGRFIGTFSVTKVLVQNGHLMAQGVLSGVLLRNAGGVMPRATTMAAQPGSGLINQVVTLPLTASGGCPILHLVLGPLTLNLLGLQITLNQVTLDITAIPGAGNLLGNLLCDVANLLNNGGGLANLLNSLLAGL